MIINSLLGYAIYCNNSSGMDNVKQTMLDFYTEEEITGAKRSLWMDCGQDLKKKYQIRRSTDSRIAAVADINDIMEAIVYLDANGKLPDVVVRDIGRLPDRQPEELNMLYVAKKVADIDKSTKIHEEVLTSLKMDVMKLQDNAKEKCSHVYNGKDNNTNTDSEQENINSSEDNDTSSNTSSEEDTSGRISLDPVPRVEGRRWGPPRRNSKPIIQANQPDQQSNRNPVTEINNGPKSIIRNNQEQSTPQNVENPRIGLEGAPLPERTVFVSRVNRGDIDSIKNFLEDNNVNVIEIVKKSHSEAKFKSFKIKITLTDLRKVLNNTFWPRGILCNKWREPAPRNTFSYNIDYANDY